MEIQSLNSEQAEGICERLRNADIKYFEAIPFKGTEYLSSSSIENINYRQEDGTRGNVGFYERFER